jgi:DNA (cytosine-5)-methyltransferase 1
MGKRIGYRKIGEYMNIFELLLPRYKLPSKPKLFESFAGIGCQRMALDKLGIDYEVVGISEIDKYALASYKAMHNECPNLGSITDIKGKDMPKTDIFTYSFPCTDLSKAGQQKGLNTNTRSGLIFEVLRLLHEMQEHNKLPQVLIMENVVDLVQVKFIEQWKEIQFEIEQMGYTNYTFTMNAKNYGVAQNRDRVFMVSILGNYYYEQPKPIPLEKRLKDYLEPNVDESYYLSDKMLNFFQENSIKNESKGNGFRFKPKDNESVANAITTLAGNRMDDNFVGTSVRLGGIFDNYKGKHQAGSIWSKNALSPTIDTMQGGYRQPMIMIPESNDKGYAEAYNGDGVYINRPQNKHKSVYKELTPTIKTTENDVGVVVNGFYKQALDTLANNDVKYGDSISAYNQTVDKSGCSPTITTRPEGKKTAILPITQDLRIRKLTPKECWRLMGIDDSYFDKASQVVSKSQLYKQAGNGIVVDVFAHILKELL